MESIGIDWIDLIGVISGWINISCSQDQQGRSEIHPGCFRDRVQDLQPHSHLSTLSPGWSTVIYTIWVRSSKTLCAKQQIMQFNHVNIYILRFNQLVVNHDVMFMMSRLYWGKFIWNSPGLYRYSATSNDASNYQENPFSAWCLLTVWYRSILM